MDSVKAYKIVCEKENPYESYEWVNAMECKGLSLPPFPFIGLLPSDYEEAAKKTIQQTMLRSARRRVMQPLIQYCAGDMSPKTIPLPSQWLSILENGGVFVDRVHSKVAFFKEQCRAWGRGFVAFQSKMHCALKSYKEDSPYHMYPDLPEQACVYTPDRENFIRWLYDTGEVPKDAKLLVTARRAFHSDNVRYCPYIFPRLSRVRAFSFFTESFYIFFVSFLRWVCGGWHIPFILNELISWAYFKRIDNPAKRYAFNNSSYAIRPLWTYLAKEKGSDIILYFYSGNTNVFYAGQQDDAPPTPGYPSMSWPCYWVLDADQKRFLIHQCGIKEDVFVKGMINHIDNGAIIPRTDKPIIALFDIPVYDANYIANLGIIAPFYTLEIVGRFVRDIMDVARKYDFQVYWKTKRDMSANPNIAGYNEIIRNHENEPGLTFVDPGISAKRLMQYADVGISMPFTSAILSGEGKPCCFYDPMSVLTYSKGLARGLPVIQGKEALDGFFNGLARQKETA